MGLIRKLKEILDNIPWVILIIAALFLGAAPVHPIPHLFEKLEMLTNGTLTKPIDLFDLLLHSFPLLLLFIKTLFAVILSTSHDS